MKRCFVCECEIETDVHDTIYGATIWRSNGNYGSTVYDPINDESHYLETCICDKCLVKKQHLLEEVHFRRKFEVLDRKQPNFSTEPPPF